jgi:predicted MFS family arabinose efflux permease
MLSGEFRKLWAGQTISAVGSSITYVALPLTAALVLGADAQQMGVLVAAGWVPFLLFALFAGVWSDRLPRKPLLIVTDLVRAAVLATIPIAAVLGVLRIEQVIVVAFLVGSMTVLFQAAYRPFIPVLVGRESLVEANSKLAMSESTARVVGPSLGGALVQLLTAPIAIAFDALSFVISATAVAMMSVHESPPPPSERKAMWTEIAEGLRACLTDRFIRTTMTVGALFNVAITMGDAVYVLYATRTLGLDAGLIGGVYTVGGIASLIGASTVQALIRRTGIGPGMLGALAVIAAASALVLAAGGSPLVAAGYLAARGALTSFSAMVYNVTSTSVVQAVTPDRLLGRVGGAGQVVSLGLIPIAALTGGWLGQHVGLWNTLALSMVAQLLSFAIVAMSPLRTIRRTSDLVTGASAAT